jgi:hypothetical protein
MRTTSKWNWKWSFVLAAIAVGFVAVGGRAISAQAQDKYTLRLPGGLPFSDWKGYESWQLVSLAETDERLKAIVANPTMSDAYKAGVPGNGKKFPDGSKIAKIQWKPKKSTEAPFAVNVPDTYADIFLMQKDSKRFPNTGRMGIRAVRLRPQDRHVHAQQGRHPRLRKQVPQGGRREGLHLPPVPEALNGARPS